MSKATEMEMVNMLKEIKGELVSLGERVSKLESEKATPSQKGKKQSASKPQTKSEDKWGKYTPKKDKDGYWNFRSYKACRQRYLDDHGFSYEEKGWMSKEDFAKACKPWTDKFGQYTKKDDRK